jgi:WD40 repeat protein
MLLGGCSSVSSQTLEYSPLSQKFVFCGDAHAYIYDTRGLCKLDAIIPFCEKIQTQYISDIKKTAMLPSTQAEQTKDNVRKYFSKKFVTGKESAKVYEFILGMDLNTDVWGGVGVSCVDWHPTVKNLLAAISLKTNVLEIWNVEIG